MMGHVQGFWCTALQRHPSPDRGGGTIAKRWWVGSSRTCIRVPVEKNPTRLLASLASTLPGSGRDEVPLAGPLKAALPVARCMEAFLATDARTRACP